MADDGDRDAAGREAGDLYTLARTALGPAVRFLWRVHVVGLEHVPARGPAILAPNHLSFLDSAFLLLRLPRRITFVGTAEHPDGWKTRYLLPAVGMIPVRASGADAAEGALAAAVGVLDRGELFGIFPEGNRSRTGQLHKGQIGVARLAVRTGAPIVPVGIIGTDVIQPPDAVLPRPFLPATITFGCPIDVERYRRRGDDSMVLRELTDEVMYEIRELTGQTYVDRYSTRPPARTPDAASPDVASAAEPGHLSGVG